MSILALPTEIIALVADASCLGESIILRLPASKESSIVTFSHVCASWRAIAFSLRHLWTNYILDVRARRSGSKQDHWVEQWFAQWISLARNQPLRLEIVQEDPDHGLGALMRLLALHSHKIGSLVLDIPDKTFVSLAKHASFRFTALETLIIRLHLNVEEKQALLPWNRSSRFFAKMPKLENLELGYHEWYPLEIIVAQFDQWALPLGQLRLLSIPHLWLELPELLDVLENCPELTRFDAFVDAPPVHDQPLADDLVPVHLPKLETLVLTFRMEHPTIWTQLVVPSLKVLDISMLTGLDDDEDDEDCITPDNIERFYTDQPAAETVFFRLLCA